MAETSSSTVRAYVVTAQCETGEAMMARVEAPNFDEAVSQTERRAEERFGMRTFRVTGVIEQPVTSGVLFTTLKGGGL